MTTEAKENGGTKPLTGLLKLTEEACFAMSDFVQKVYKRLTDDRKMMTTKADNSFFTIADSLVQLMTQTLYPLDKFKEFCGEESQKNINVAKRPYSIDGLPVPDDIADSFDKVFKDISAIAAQISSTQYKDIGIFVDPIDGTREFCNGKGEQCSICIGFTRDEVPVAGIVFRPIPLSPGGKLTYMSGAKEEGYKHGELDLVEGAPASILTTNGSISQFTKNLMEELKYERTKAGGCGNKMMLLLEGKGTAYIQDRGVSRWDTCAAQAVIEACGGVLCKLSVVESTGKLESYHYRVGDKNLDFNEGAMFTKYNIRDKSLLKQDPPPKISEELVQPYSNLCGIFAVKAQDDKLIASLTKAIQDISKTSKPEYS
mmetsp:Transcript_6476/g.11938  ORF Transcript_6476/g.11938 Transcript_6476/m.11938 type:complete len:371 (+) Transcript_6476:207-1319(+)